MKEEPDANGAFFNSISKEDLFRIFLNQVDLCVWFKDVNQHYTLCSSSFARLLGYQTSDAIIGKTLHDFIDRDQADAHSAEELRIHKQKLPILNKEEHITLSGSRATQGDLWISYSIYPLTDTDGNVCGTWGMAKDITDVKSTEQKLVQKNKQCDDLSSKIHQLSTIDEVTNLYNRKYFEEMIRRNMRLFSRVRGRGYNAGFTIVLMDIDHFTRFCTENGVMYKEIALQYIADILRSCARSSDDIFRVGEDEFGLLLSDTAFEGGEILAGRIRSALIRKPLVIGEKEIFLTMSFGYSSYTDQLDASELIQQADQNLFDSKEKRSK
ncbi:MAG: sensor domain-containing diguanylate cyclase [Clostridiales bacterium]|nr:sensor domain-containing diguanylate cyclase [Clostridiales bacterium]